MAPKAPVVLQKVGGIFELQDKLGSGCFGEVYRGLNVENHEAVAIKLEPLSAEVPQLKLESTILAVLNPANDPESIGFAYCYFYGPQNAYNCLVMPLMSSSLEDCVKKCNGKLSAKSTLIIADQMLMRIEYMHHKSYLHRDIKPENFMWGAGAKQNVLHLIDFGLSKKWHSGRSHVPFVKGRTLTGTARYASIPVHQGHEQGRRDDMEAIGHMLVYFLMGTLPWSGLDAKTKKEKYERIQRSKETVPIADLCGGHHAFERYLEITRALTFTQRPDYEYLRELFTDAFDKVGYKLDYDFEWFDEKPTNLVSIPPWACGPQPDERAGNSSRFCSLM